MHVTCWKVHCTQCMRGEGEGGFSCLELDVVTCVVKEPPLEVEGPLLELKRVRNPGDVDDGVAEFHGGKKWCREGGSCCVFSAPQAEKALLVRSNLLR